MTRSTKSICVACKGTRIDTLGNDCVCVTGPRKLPNKRGRKPAPRIERRRSPRATDEFSVTFVQRDARRLFTTTPGTAPPSEFIDGSIVRVAGDESHSMADLAAHGQSLVEMGATTFKAVVAPARPGLRRHDQVSVAVSNPRTVVEAILVAENNAALSDTVRDSMEVAGL